MKRLKFVYSGSVRVCERHIEWIDALLYYDVSACCLNGLSRKMQTVFFYLALSLTLFLRFSIFCAYLLFVRVFFLRSFTKRCCYCCHGCFYFCSCFPGGCLYICLYAKLLLFSLSLLFASSLFEFE